MKQPGAGYLAALPSPWLPPLPAAFVFTPLLRLLLLLLLQALY